MLVKRGTRRAEKHSSQKVVSEVLSQVLFAVGPLGPQVHPMVISPVPKCIIKLDISAVVRAPTWVPWLVGLELLWWEGPNGCLWNYTPLP